ncbi:DNA topology modulation protein FlaR [Agaribacter marinus]|uniref:DNA topology modulation protein FlaR n=1 Tax=Virgibacillus salarius TaxID=447199 RepID=A0A941DUU5_9BACI|nr:shikimate kinase [Virgibacillus salarius]MBR7797150.1 DNA topology modulation protein FlaR [Virgibacillus salarius]NAZ09859.1 DNA topology modulation protein FlaR [Agaribacter marinus]
MKIPSKIRIIGSVGSGKTTLAKLLAKQLRITYYELDNVVWYRRKTGDIKRTIEERTKILSSICQQSAWIIKGVHRDNWVIPSIKHADLIIILDTNKHVRSFRICKRFLRQKLGIEPANYQPTLSIFISMLQWNRQFEQKKQDICNMLSSYNDKQVIITNKQALKTYLSTLRVNHE